MTHGYGQMHTRPGEPMGPTRIVGKAVGEQEERNMIEFLPHTKIQSQGDFSYVPAVRTHD